MSTTQSARDRARQTAFSNKGKREKVEHEGVVYEVCALSPKAIRDAEEASQKVVKENGKPARDGDNRILTKTDRVEMTARLLIAATYVQGEKGLERVFDVADLASLMDAPAYPGSLYAKLSVAFAKLQEVEVEEEKGNSESPGETSSSA